MLVKTYGYSLHLNAETTKKKIIYSIDPEIHCLPLWVSPIK